MALRTAWATKRGQGRSKLYSEASSRNKTGAGPRLRGRGRELVAERLPNKPTGALGYSPQHSPTKLFGGVGMQLDG